jgi:hypothetical protein
MTPGITQAGETVALAKQAVHTTAAKRDKLLKDRDDLSRIIAETEQAERLATVEALALGIKPPETPRETERRMKSALRSLNAMPEAIGQAESDLAAARKHLEAAETVFLGAIGQFLSDEMASVVSEIEVKHVTPMLEALAQMAALELVRERLIGSAPVSGINLNQPLFSGRVIALNAFAGIPLRLRGPTTSDQIMARAATIADSIQAQIKKGKDNG